MVNDDEDFIYEIAALTLPRYYHFGKKLTKTHVLYNQYLFYVAGHVKSSSRFYSTGCSGKLIYFKIILIYFLKYM